MMKENSVLRTTVTSCTNTKRNDGFQSPIENPPNRRGEVRPRPKYFSPQGWKERKDKIRVQGQAHQKVAQHFQLRLETVFDEVKERSNGNERLEASRHVQDVKFWQEKLQMKLVELGKQVDAISSQRNTVESCSESVRHIKSVDEQIFKLRESRRDDIGNLLIEENKISDRVLGILKQIMEQYAGQTKVIEKAKEYVNKEMSEPRCSLNNSSVELFVRKLMLKVDKIIEDTHKFSDHIESSMSTTLEKLKSKIAQTDSIVERHVTTSMLQSHDLMVEHCKMLRKILDAHSLSDKLGEAVNKKKKELVVFARQLRLLYRGCKNGLTQEEVHKQLTVLTQHKKRLTYIKKEIAQVEGARKRFDSRMTELQKLLRISISTHELNKKVMRMRESILCSDNKIFLY